MSILESVKTALRVRTDDAGIRNEISELVEAARAELRGVGIVSADLITGAEVSDDLIRRAIILYCKAHFGFSDDQEKYIRIYESLKTYLILAEDYRLPEEPV